MHVSCYADATTGIITKHIFSLPEQTDNRLITKDDKSELKTKLQGIKDLRIMF